MLIAITVDMYDTQRKDNAAFTARTLLFTTRENLRSIAALQCYRYTSLLTVTQYGVNKSARRKVVGIV